MGYRDVVARRTSLTLASALLGTTGAVRPVFLPLAIVGPIALWWRFGAVAATSAGARTEAGRVHTALYLGWIPALWAGLWVVMVRTSPQPDWASYYLFSLMVTVGGLIAARYIVRALTHFDIPRPIGTRVITQIAETGPRALALRFGIMCHYLARGHKGIGLVVSQPDTHTLVLGPSRTGKTTSVITPNAMAWTAGSLVVASSKHDVLKAAGAIRATLSPEGKIYLLDVLGTVDDRELHPCVQRVHWTPLRGCQDWNVARTQASALLGAGRKGSGSGGTAGGNDADHWAAQGERLLAPLLHAAARCQLSLREVVLWASDPESLSEPLGLLEELSFSTANGHDHRTSSGVASAEAAAKNAQEAHAQLRGVIGQESKHRSSVVSTVTTALHPYSGRVLDEAASAKESDWDPEAFLSGTNTLFVVAPTDSEVDSPAAIVVGVLAELYGATRRLSDAMGNNGRLPYPALWVLDEVATICPLPRLPQWMAEAAGRGLTFILGVQDYAQLSERWGRDGATTMWSNATNKVVFPGISNPETLRQLEQLAGTYWANQVSTTAQPLSRWARGNRLRIRRRYYVSTTTSQTQLPRWTQDALYGMPQASCLIFRPDWPQPYLLPQNRAYCSEPFATWYRQPWPHREGILHLAGHATTARPELAETR